MVSMASPAPSIPANILMSMAKGVSNESMAARLADAKDLITYMLRLVDDTQQMERSVDLQPYEADLEDQSLQDVRQKLAFFVEMLPQIAKTVTDSRISLAAEKLKSLLRRKAQLNKIFKTNVKKEDSFYVKKCYFRWKIVFQKQSTT